MQAIRRLFSSAVVLSAVFLFSTSNTAAQNPCDDAEGIAVLDAKIRISYQKPETLNVAVEGGKEYLRKYGECADLKAFSAWLTEQLPKWEQAPRIAKIKKFDDAVKARNYDEMYAVGKELVEHFPDNVHFVLPMAMVGLPETYKKNHKYNDESIKYAKMALAKLKSGTAEPKKDKDGKPRTDSNGNPLFGIYQFERNVDEAVSELTYGLGYILYHAKKDRRAGLLYLYEASQLPGTYKTEPLLFATIGQYFSEESKPINNEIIALAEKFKVAATDEEKVKIDAEIKAKEALYNGYAERALDAFSHAYKFSNEKIASEKTLKAQVYSEMQALFERRFEKKEGVDKWIVAASAKVLPDPTTQVAPVFDPEPVKPILTDPAPAGKSAKAPAVAKPAGTKRKPATPGKRKP